MHYLGFWPVLHQPAFLKRAVTGCCGQFLHELSMNWSPISVNQRQAYDNWFCFEDKVLVQAYTVSGWQSKKYYQLEDGFVMLKGLYVPPKLRRKGHLKRFLEHAMEIADKNQSYVCAVCRPFYHQSEKTDEEIPNIEQIARDFATSQSAMPYSSVKEKEGKTRQQRMASTLTGLGWESCDLTENMDFPELFGDFGFIY